MLKTDFPDVKVFPILGSYPTMMVDVLKKQTTHLVVIFHTEKTSGYFRILASQTSFYGGNFQMFYKTNYIHFRNIDCLGIKSIKILIADNGEDRACCLCKTETMCDTYCKVCQELMCGPCSIKLIQSDPSCVISEAEIHLKCPVCRQMMKVQYDSKKTK